MINNQYFWYQKIKISLLSIKSVLLLTIVNSRLINILTEEYHAKGITAKGLTRRNKMLLAAVKLFLENGYEKTTTAAIARKAGMAPSSFLQPLKIRRRCFWH